MSVPAECAQQTHGLFDVFDTLRAIARRELVPIIQRYELGGSRSLPHARPQTLISTTDPEMAQRALACVRDPGATHALEVGYWDQFWAARWRTQDNLPGSIYRIRPGGWQCLAAVNREYVQDDGVLSGPIPVGLTLWLRERARNT